MKIREIEDKLFKEWSAVCPGVVSDGIVDEDEYNKAKVKVLFLLKEVNDPKGGEWDLRDFLKNGGRSQTWDNITRWLIGINNLPDHIPWNDLETITRFQRRSYLKQIIAMNLKKSPGHHTTDNIALTSEAMSDTERLNHQFALYEPDLIICCGSIVEELAHRLLNGLKKPNWKQSSRGVWYHEKESGKFVISYAHPEARVANNLLYYGLIDSLREIIAVL